ncbi:MAG: hypothetical protein HZC54_02420 [Verrucomicrobia bacterium]|nr:hypothetical protein [Verrucomicrobiota bacterium]
MLFLNLLRIAETSARRPEKLDLYMRQTLLQLHTQHQTAPPPPPQPGQQPSA